MQKPNNSQLFNSLQEKMEQIKFQPTRTKTRASIKSKLPEVDNIGIDGVDHINIWERAATEIGVALSHKSNLPFIHSEHDKFRSIEGFWYFIRSVSKDERLRTISGYKAKKFGETLDSQYVDDFKATIMEANWQKVKQYAPLVEELNNSTLPFDSYYLLNNDPAMRRRPASGFWIIDGFEEIRKAIKENREPDFTFLKDNTHHKNKNVNHFQPNSLTSRLTTIAKSFLKPSQVPVKPNLKHIKEEDISLPETETIEVIDKILDKA